MESEEMQQRLIEPELVPGDLAASEGRWSEAIDIWDRAAQSSPILRETAGARITWFLSHQPDARGASTLARSLYLMLLSLAAAIMATALVLLPENPGSASSNVMAIGAWALIALSAFTAIVAARRIGTGRTTNSGERADRIAEDRRLASNLEMQHVTGDPSND